MKKSIALLLTFFVLSLSYAQKNKFDDILNSRKLGASIKTIKDKDKEEYYQQYYWLRKMEELKAFPNLAGIKPKVLYNFVREINPVNKTKELSDKDKQLRKTAEHSLNQFFEKKDFNNPLVMYNLESYVDPSSLKYYTGVNPERIKALVPKQVYTFSSFNKKTQDEKTYYLWVKDDDYNIVNPFPAESDKKFYTILNRFVPGFKIPTYVPAVALGDKKSKKDSEFYYVTPFQTGNDNIVYRTKDFKEYELVRYKTAGGPWTDLDKKDKTEK